MSLSRTAPKTLTSTRSLLNSLIEMPDLAQTVAALPAPTFAALIRKIGVEDAGEIVALATTEQLVQAFDEELFVNERAGERETLDVRRFVVWLEVLLEAGDEATARRVAVLDEEFVTHALSNIVLVLDQDALRQRLDEGDEDEAWQVDKSLESALTEELDGYILVAKQHEGWDAALSLILALDRNHRALLERILDRLAAVASGYLDDLDELSTVLSEGESLAEDVEAAREERRSKQGYVEPRAARGFLSLARKPPEADAPGERDPLTRAYFRELERAHSARASGGRATRAAATHALPAAVKRELEEAHQTLSPALPSMNAHLRTFTEALQALSEREPTCFDARVEELAYLTNVLLSGFEQKKGRLTPKAAAEAALCTVCFGAHLALRAPGTKKRRAVTVEQLGSLLGERPLDGLFRLASSALASGAVKVPASKERALLLSSEELERALG